MKGLEKTEKGEILERKSTSNDDYKPEDSQFDIMIRNNENLITALIGKSDGDEDTNLSKALQDGIVSNGKTIGQHIGGIQQGILLFKAKLKAKFAEIQAYSVALSAHTHIVVPAVPPSPVTVGGISAPGLPVVPLVLAPIPRTGPLGDGSPITPEDTKLTIKWANEAAAFVNMTEGERAVFQTMSHDTDDLLRFLESVREVANVTNLPGKNILHLASICTDTSGVHVHSHGDERNHSHAAEHTHNFEEGLGYEGKQLWMGGVVHMASVPKSRGPNGLQLEVGVQRAP